MMKTMKTALTVMMLTTLTACDYSEVRSRDRERANRTYRAAMGDYQSGRIAQAIKALKEVCAEDPANGSARFQLACLLQDHEKDFLGAYLAFLEFLNQHPESEKAHLAAERIKDCEKDVAAKLANKYGLNQALVEKNSLESLRADYKESEQRCQKLSGELKAALARVSDLTREAARLKEALKGIGDEEASQAKADVSDAKAVLEDDRESVRPDETLDILDAKALLDANEDENSSPVIKQAADAKAKRDAAAEAAKNRPKTPEEILREKRPSHYVVQEGDTLYKIAMRFYGRSSVWSRIRDANKAVISTDGRVRAGQKLVLPND